MLYPASAIYYPGSYLKHVRWFVIAQQVDSASFLHVFSDLFFRPTLLVVAVEVIRDNAHGVYCMALASPHASFEEPTVLIRRVVFEA